MMMMTMMMMTKMMWGTGVTDLFSNVVSAVYYPHHLFNPLQWI